MQSAHRRKVSIRRGVADGASENVPSTAGRRRASILAPKVKLKAELRTAEWGESIWTTPVLIGLGEMRGIGSWFLGFLLVCNVSMQARSPPAA